VVFDSKYGGKVRPPTVNLKGIADDRNEKP
jgi:hypothetical protein